MSFVAIEFVVCNDGCAPHRIPKATFFDTRKEAIRHIATEATQQEAGCGEEAEESDVELIEKYVQSNPEQGLWCWEWKRKGNGTLYVVRECENTVDAMLSLLSHNLHLFDEECKIIEQSKNVKKLQKQQPDSDDSD
jgi:hypothetical protein